ncbi:RHS repeat-associated core domain-containing protein [candidate division TA06 bacterium]|nr:RHS repeat-associated core domain-containing protein [candidate division TA06 bacterium]
MPGAHTEKNPGIRDLNYSEGSEGINPLNGGVFLHQSDLGLTGRNGGLPMTRFYSSKRVWRQTIANEVSSRQAVNYNEYNTYYTHVPPSGIMGQGWDFNMGRMYLPINDSLGAGWPPARYKYEEPSGISHSLDTIGNTSNYRSADGQYLRLNNYSTSCTLRISSGSEVTFADGLDYMYLPNWIQDALGYGSVLLPVKVTDRNGNYINISYKGDPVGNEVRYIQIDSIVSSNGSKMFCYASYKKYTPVNDSVLLMDSMKTRGYNGVNQTVKYHYKLYKTTSQPFEYYGQDYVFDEERWCAVALTDTIRRYCLSAVLFPNGDSVAYDYNQYFELSKQTLPTGGSSEYSYGNYGFPLLDNNNNYTRFTRAADTLKAKENDGSLVSKITFTRNVVAGYYSNPTDVRITDSQGGETRTYFMYSQTPFKSGGYGKVEKEVHYDFAGNVIDSVKYTTISDDLYLGTPLTYGRNMRPDSIVSYIGSKKYCTRYRQYDGYGNFQRIDNLGDMGTTADNNSVFTTYLHNSKTQYNFDNKHILNLPCSTYVKPDSASTVVLSKTKFFYDDTTRTDTTSYSSYPPVNWQSPGMIRGNITRACRWKAGALYDTTQIFYDKLGNVIKTINAKGDSSKVSYSALGSYYPDKFQYAWPCSTVSYVANGANVLALSSITDYDSCTGLVLWSAGANRDTTRFEYDTYGRPIKAVKPGEWAGSWGSTYPSAVTHYYDSGYPRSTVDSVKITGTKYAVSKTFYNGFGRAIQAQKTELNGYATIANTAYDSLGRVQKASNPIATVTTFGTYVSTDYWSSQPKVRYYYDAIGRPLKTVYQDSTRDSVAFGDNWVKTWDAKGDTAIAKVNGPGMADTTINGLGLLTIVKHDKLGRDSVIIDAAGKSTYCYYDTLGRTKGANGTDASSSYTYKGAALDFLLEYDAVDNITCRKNAKGVVNYTYDALKRVTKVDSAGSDRVLYKYDSYTDCNYSPSDTLYAKGRITRLITAGIDTTWFAYDKAGRLVKRVYAYAGMNGGRDSIRYAYNSADACTALTYPDGTVAKYSYNTLGQLMSVKSASYYYVDSTYYNVTNLAKKIQYSNYTSDSMFYDNRLRINRLKTTNYVWEIPATYSRMDLSYSYWEDGYIKKIQDNLNSSYTQYYDSSISYDAAGRLTVCKTGSTVISYTYDNVGNRTAEVIGGTSRALTYTSGTNKLATANIKGTTYWYIHDNAGNVTGKEASGGYYYSYDYNNMLCKMNQLDAMDRTVRTVTNYYGMGGSTRVKKKDSQLGSRYYTYEGLNPLCEYDSTGTVKKKYVYAFGECIAYEDSVSNVYWMHHDAIGSVKVITDCNGDSVSTYKYYPFGDSLLTRGSAKNDMQFTGKPNIAGIEAYDFNARYYDPEIGRFYSIDPLWNPAVSPYAYCNNNPVNFTDPTGKKADPVQQEKALQQALHDLYSGHVSSFTLVDGDIRITYALMWVEDHTRPICGADGEGFSGYYVQNRLFTELMNAVKGGNGGGNTNSGPTPPKTTPGSELGATTGGSGRSGATDPTGNGGVPTSQGRDLPSQIANAWKNLNTSVIDGINRMLNSYPGQVGTTALPTAYCGSFPVAEGLGAGIVAPQTVKAAMYEEFHRSMLDSLDAAIQRGGGFGDNCPTDNSDSTVFDDYGKRHP